MVKSDNFSFKGWNIAEFVKGRKKMVIAVIAGLLGYVLSDSALVTALAAAGGDVVVAVVEYYCKKY